jgi:hypothetical protein
MCNNIGVNEMSTRKLFTMVLVAAVAMPAGWAGAAQLFGGGIFEYTPNLQDQAEVFTGLSLPVRQSDVRVVEPTYEGFQGNPEMVALRPYKWAFRSVRSLVHQTFIAFRDGNIRSPIIGTAYTVRGVRQGLVETGEGAYRGLTFARPPRGNHFHYKNTNKWNEFINNDWLLRNSTDFLTSVLLMNAMTGSIDSNDRVALLAGGWALFKATQHYPYNSQWQEDMASMYAWTERRRVENAMKRNDPDRVKNAQRRYIGSRADINPVE